MPDKEASKPTPPADVQVPEKRLEPNPENNRPNTPINAPLSPIDDATTDKAVDDIVIHESDVVLAAEDAATAKTSVPVTAPGWKAKCTELFKNKWTWLGIALAVIVVFAIPYTRYTLLGLALKESVSITVKDSKTNTPVSDASISLDGESTKTDAAGKATFKVPPGHSTLTISKRYYESYAQAYTVGLESGKTANIDIIATGRQVPVTILNTLTGKPLAGVEIRVLDTSAKTNQKGQATIVLPTKTARDNATISLNGYNSVHASVEVTSSVVSANTVSLTPAGQVYFLSNLSGTIDVVKTNLDGSDRQTILAGTGDETPSTTSLLASRDWRYLVLEAQRSGSQPALYLINTSDDKVTEFDNGNATFTLVGWYGHDFIYDVVRNNIPAWQDGHEALKSYDADTGQLNLLDQNQAAGDSTDYAYQAFYNYYIVNGLVTYNTQWYTYDADGTTYDLTGKTDTIRAVQPNGQGKKDYQSVPASNVGSFQAVLYEPNGIYYAVYSYDTDQTTYYSFSNQTLSTVTNLAQDTFSQTYPTYLVSPSGTQTFWAEPRDGKNTLFVGDQNAQNQKQIATLSNYAPYGWYGNNYILVSQNDSELYIMPAGGLSANRQPLKIADYYQPTQTYPGYGYGYGGL